MVKSGKTSDPDNGTVQGQAERLAHSLGESAQQVWLAGIGALARAQTGGSRLFDSLVQEGIETGRDAHGFADRQGATARRGAGSARGRAADSWDRVERAFEDRVQRTLSRLGVPVRADLAELGHRIDELTAELRRGDTRRAPGAGARPAAKKATRSSVHASPIRKTTARKTVRRAGTTPPTSNG